MENISPVNKGYKLEVAYRAIEVIFNFHCQWVSLSPQYIA